MDDPNRGAESASGWTGPVPSAGQGPADASGIIRPPSTSDPGQVPMSMAAPTTWIQVVGGAMALGWLLIILGPMTGGATIGLALPLMWPAAIWWRIKTGRQLGPGSAAWLKNVVDQRTANKVADSHLTEAIDRAVSPMPSLHDHGMDRAQYKVGGWIMKRALLMSAGMFLCFVRPVMAGFGELRILRATR